MSSKCPFCTVSQERILLANKHCLTFPDSFPISQGHTLVVPIRHVASIFGLSAEEQSDVWHLVDEVRSQLANALYPDGFNIGLNDGPAAGQTIDHAHVHVIPRYKGDVEDPRGGIRWVLPEKAKYWSSNK